ncbi:MAG: electron transport complex subunit E [Oscillospiraceae bacterium]|nr:electron transport complex subunit E [Oscillospiraceae bacterium]
MAEKCEKTNYKKILTDGLWDKNPIFVQLLGMCSTLAITTGVPNGIAMGLCVTVVLIFSNIFISLVRKIIPRQIRIASYIVIISTFVTIIELIMKAYFPALDKSLGLFIPLIVVNCIILARAEAFASKNSVLPSAVDGLSAGLGYTLALIVVSAIREIFGNGTICGVQIMPDGYVPILSFVTPAGAFITLGCVIALAAYINNLRAVKADKAKANGGKG